MNEANEFDEESIGARTRYRHEENEINEQRQDRGWTASDLIAALYELQGIDAGSLDPDILASQRSAAAILTTVTDRGALAGFLDWFMGERPGLDRCDPKDALRLWHDYYLYRVREAHRRAA